MKKLLWLSAFTLTMIAGSAHAHAVDAAETGPQTSTAQIEFTENNDVTPPIDNNNDDEETGMKGPLSLDMVPNLDFGQHVVKSATSFADTGEHRIQVTDSRAANDGWNVMLTVGEFTSGGNTLTGATLTTGGDALVAAGVNNQIDTTIDNSGVHSVGLTSIAADGTQASRIFYGDNATTSTGTWQAIYANNTENFTLSAPATTQAVGTFTANLTWTISAGPGA